MSEWRPVTLGSVTSNYDAKRRPVKTTQRIAGPYPYYGASGIIDYVEDFVLDGDYLLIAEDGENLRTRSTPVAFLASGKLWVNNHAHVVTGNHLADTRFLSHLLSITDISGYLTGSTQPKLTRSAMDSIALQVPSIETQRAIAEVLGALDDKIAANLKLVSTSREMLVNLLSGNAPSIALGEIVDHRKNTVDVNAVIAPTVSHFSLPAFDIAQMPDITSPKSIMSSKFLIEEPSVLISKLNPRTPRIWDIQEVPDALALASTEFLVLKPRYCSTTVLWAILSQPAFTSLLEGKVAGTSGSHQRVKPGDLLATEVVDPRSIDSDQQDLMAALGMRIQVAQRENRTLAATRDALLPHLMSGILRVRDAEKAVEAVV